MPPQLLAWISLGSFAAAGAIGLGLLTAHSRRIRVPLIAAFPHGFFAGGGLLLLMLAVIMGWGEEESLGPWPVVSLVILLGAAGAGVTLFYLHASTGAIPKWLGIAHGSAALLGVLILFLAMVGQSWTSEPVPINPVELETRTNPATAEPRAPAGR